VDLLVSIYVIACLFLDKSKWRLEAFIEKDIVFTKASLQIQKLSSPIIELMSHLLKRGLSEPNGIELFRTDGN
jgi:hypothetical protein